jgi:membrane fusion protein, copper/silver efflux system
VWWRKIVFSRVPINPDVTSPALKKERMGRNTPPADESAVKGDTPAMPGRETVTIDSRHQQLLALETAPVTVGPVGGAWRTVGRVVVDDKRVYRVTVKTPVVIESIYADFVGKTVRQGDPLFSVYSPELVSAQQRYLIALRARDTLLKQGSRMTESEALVQAARRKLLSWDIPAQEIDRAAATGQPSRTLTIYSPVSGVMTKREAAQGTRLEAGAAVCEIVDLARVWVLADISENDIRFVARGMRATFTTNVYPHREFEGEVLLVDPVRDPVTRAAKARVNFANASGELHPEMYGEVTLKGKPRRALRIPVDAVVDSGADKLVFVAAADGKVQPRIILAGQTSGRDIEVLSGLEQSDRVVTRANLLVDSDSKLRALSATAATTDKSNPSVPTPSKTDRDSGGLK